jgi:hypothetical protein
MATVAAGVDFVAEEMRGGWKLSFWNEQVGGMDVIDKFTSFSELRDHVDLNAPKYARFNRNVRAHARAGRAVNQPDVGFGIRDELMADAESCGEFGDIECMEHVLKKARRELSLDPNLLFDVENVVDTYFPELMKDDTGALKRRLTQ